MGSLEFFLLLGLLLPPLHRPTAALRLVLGPRRKLALPAAVLFPGGQTRLPAARDPTLTTAAEQRPHFISFLPHSAAVCPQWAQADIAARGRARAVPEGHPVDHKAAPGPPRGE